MKANNYWENEDYKEALNGYSDYSQMCRSLNQFNPKDQWAFSKRDMYAEKMNEIKEKFSSTSVERAAKMNDYTFGTVVLVDYGKGE